MKRTQMQQTLERLSSRLCYTCVKVQAFCELLPVKGHRRPLSLSTVVPSFRSLDPRQIIIINTSRNLADAIQNLIDKPCRHQQLSDTRRELPPAGSAPVSWPPCLALRRPHRESRVAGTSRKRARPVSESPSDLPRPCSPAGLARCTCAHTTERTNLSS